MFKVTWNNETGPPKDGKQLCSEERRRRTEPVPTVKTQGNQEASCGSPLQG